MPNIFKLNLTKTPLIMRYLFLFSLIIFSFYSCNNAEKEKKEKIEKPSVSPKITAKDSTGLKIAYYDLDTLQQKYLFFKNEYEVMSKKKNAFEKELLKKQSDFQKFVERNEERAQKGLLSQNQLAELQNKAQKMQEEYAIFEQKKTIEMQSEFEQKLTLISKNLETYAKEFCEKNNIDILLQSGQSSQIGYIHPSMNTTDEFINYLNQKQAEIDKDLK